MITIRDIFIKDRFPSGWKFLPLLIYSPVGLILAVLRVFIGIQTIIAASILYKLASIRTVVLRFMCSILGIIVIKENEEYEDDSVKIIVSNHVSLLDHLVINLLKNSVSVNVCEFPSLFHYALNYIHLGSYRNQETLIQNVKKLINSGVTVDIQPEMAITSGQKGLLRFSSWPCKLSHPIQPVTIKIWRPPLMDISPSVVKSSWSSDLFWFLFVPFTIFKIRYIPVVKQNKDETAEEMAKRLEKIIADELKILPTNFTATDKLEFEKRLSSEMTVKQQSPQIHLESGLAVMASRVKEVLPDVPLNAICRDLARTKSVDLTITNFLEGLVRYTPERNLQLSPPSKNLVLNNSKSSLDGDLPSTSFDTSSKIFHKSAQERMISFQERKLRLIQSARQRYMEKHALNIINSR